MHASTQSIKIAPGGELYIPSLSLSGPAAAAEVCIRWRWRWCRSSKWALCVSILRWPQSIDVNISPLPHQNNIKFHLQVASLVLSLSPFCCWALTSGGDHVCVPLYIMCIVYQRFWWWHSIKLKSPPPPSPNALGINYMSCCHPNSGIKFTFINFLYYKCVALISACAILLRTNIFSRN